jgi:hypothetical protein
VGFGVLDDNTIKEYFWLNIFGGQELPKPSLLPMKTAYFRWQRAYFRRFLAVENDFVYCRGITLAQQLV